MASVSDEVETTYAVAPEAALAPVLARAVGHLDGVELELEGERRHLEATYVDTADLGLLSARTTLRRRTGGPDAGWHLKLPGADDARVEVQLPLGDEADGVPPALRSLVAARVRGQELGPVARIVTERTVSRLVDGAGVVLAEVADDRVAARRLVPPAQDLQWRELEVELVEGGLPLLAAFDEQLLAGGLEHARSRSKLARTLGDPQPAPHPSFTPGSAAGEVVVHHLTEQVERLVAADPLVRLDRPDSVHRMRVASRRLRSALRTFAPVLQRAQVRPVADELRWLAGRLGEARDAEVLRDRLREQGAAAGEEVAAGVAHLDEAYHRAHDQLLLDLDSERYRRLLEALGSLVQQPPWTEAAHQPAHDVLPQRVRRAYAEVRTRMRQERWHEARKAAKRARYAAEALSDTFGEEAVAFAEAMERLQEVLGRHQDSVVMREHLLELAEGATPREAFTYGRLHAREQAHGDADLAEATQVWAEVSAKQLRRWLRR
jgi:CHAD domain-containing protein